MAGDPISLKKSSPRPTRRRRKSQAGAAGQQEASVIPGGEVADASPVSLPAPDPAAAWVPFDPSRHGAESDFPVRSGHRLATVRRNQHGQIILSSTRHLLPWVPVEMSV